MVGDSALSPHLTVAVPGAVTWTQHAVVVAEVPGGGMEKRT